MDVSSKIQRSIHDVRLTYKYVSRIFGYISGIQAVEIMKNKKNRPHDNRRHDAKARRNKSYSADTKGKQGAIIILSAKTEDADKILGLNVGADD